MDNDITTAVLVEGKPYQKLADGTLKPLTGSQTDWERLRTISDDDIDAAIAADPDAPPILDKKWFQTARLLNAAETEKITMRMDTQALEWFRAQGRGYQTRINNVLKAYVAAYID